jgi:hypothetical protein
MTIEMAWVMSAVSSFLYTVRPSAYAGWASSVVADITDILLKLVEMWRCELIIKPVDFHRPDTRTVILIHKICLETPHTLAYQSMRILAWPR